MNTNIGHGGGQDELREEIRRLYVDGELDANTATRRLLTLDSQLRTSHASGRDEDPDIGRS